jgi:hypothetical protein
LRGHRLRGHSEILPFLVSGQEEKLVLARPSRRDLRVFFGYVLCAAVYIAVGVFYTDLLLSFWVGLVYLVLTAWGVPTLVRRLLR